MPVNETGSTMIHPMTGAMIGPGQMYEEFEAVPNEKEASNSSLKKEVKTDGGSGTIKKASRGNRRQSGTVQDSEPAAE